MTDPDIVADTRLFFPAALASEIDGSKSTHAQLHNTPGNSRTGSVRPVSVPNMSSASEDDKP